MVDSRRFTNRGSHQCLHWCQQQSTGLLRFNGSNLLFMNADTKQKDRQRRPFCLVDSRRFTNRGSHQCLHWCQQQSAGLLHFNGSNLLFMNANTKQKDRQRRPFCLVDSRRFELPTPTMRMWCAPSCATSPYFI